MDEALIAAATARGIIDVDLVKLMPPSDAPAAQRVAEFAKAKPHWFGAAFGGKHASKMTAAEYTAARARAAGPRNSAEALVLSAEKLDAKYGPDPRR